MWWQIKSTRQLGAVVLAISTVSSVALGGGDVCRDVIVSGV